MVLATRFDGLTSLPAGWSKHEPGGSSIAVADGTVQFTVPAGTSLDSIFASNGINNAPSIMHAVPAGAWCVAFQVCDDIGDTKSWGWNIAACDAGGEDNSGGGWARYAIFRPNTNDERPNRFAGSRPTGSGIGSGGTSHYNSNVGTLTTSLQSGIPAFIALAFDGTDTWTPYISTDGVTWRADTSFVRAITPTRVLLQVTSTTPSTGGTLRLSQVWDPTVPIGDLRAPRPAASRVTRGQIVGTEGALPAGWVDDSVTDTVTLTGTAARFQVNAANVGSRARLHWGGTRYRACGLTLKYQAPTMSGNLFATFALTTDEGSGDVYVRDGGGYGNERGNTAFRPIRVDNPVGSNVASSPGSTGLDEKRYGWLDDLTKPALSGGAARRIRLERLCLSALPAGKAWYRVREWLDGDPEPSTWDFEGQDDIERGLLGPTIVLAHNNPVGGLTGTGTLDVTDVDFYELTADEFYIPVGRVVDVDQVRPVDLAQALPVERVVDVDTLRAVGTARGIAVGRVTEGELVRDMAGLTVAPVARVLDVEEVADVDTTVYRPGLRYTEPGRLVRHTEASE